MESPIAPETSTRLPGSPPERRLTGPYRVAGGRPLQGTLRIAGAKNAASKQILATLLTEEPCILHNIPRVGEISSLLHMLTPLGTRHGWLSADTLLVHTPRLRPAHIAPRLAFQNRLSILLVGCLLNRVGQARSPLPGGCPIGRRPIDFHCAALTAMGAEIVVGEHDVRAAAPAGLHGAIVRLPFPSVGATETVLLAAVHARGTTVLHGAAIEPEVLDTIALLQAMGGEIERTGRTLVIRGVSRLHGADHRTLPDRIEAASWAVAAAATDGEIVLEGIGAGLLAEFLPAFTALGGGVRDEGDRVRFYRQVARLRPIDVETGPYPCFSTDWLLPLAALCAQAPGRSRLHETVFERRLAGLVGLAAMGSPVEWSSECPEGRGCRFGGVEPRHVATLRAGRLRPARLTVRDLRMGFACLVAALATPGESLLWGTKHLDRGYPHLVSRLQHLGARIADS